MLAHYLNCNTLNIILCLLLDVVYVTSSIHLFEEKKTAARMEKLISSTKTIHIYIKMNETN